MDQDFHQETFYETPISNRGNAEANTGYVVIVVSTLFFFIVSNIATIFTPAHILKTPKSAWKWKNITVSLAHAVFSSLGAYLCFVERPDMAEDLITIYTIFSHSLVSFSVGYFVYDFFDLLICQPSRESFELLGHHTVIIVCFMVAVMTKNFVGYAVVALLVEINSIFLHIRQLLNICGVNKFSAGYRLNSLINLATFIIFRILLLSWMTRWILINKDSVPLIFYTLGNIGLAVMVAMNIVLFYRLLRSDLRFLTGGESCKTIEEDRHLKKAE